MSDQHSTNMEIWRQVCETDPKHVKKVDIRGGFTSPDPQIQLRRATELFGPYGTAWGIKQCQWGMIEQEPKWTMTLDAVFFYPGGQFEISVDMPFRANDDCRKKLLTAARSKALSLLGFNADIFIGQYDDERYVSDMRTKFADEDKLRETMLKAIRTSQTDDALAKCRERLDDLRGDNAINKTLYDEALQAIEEQQRELSAG